MPAPVETHQDSSLRVIVSEDIRELVPPFLDEIRSFCRSIEEALERHDYVFIQQAGHKIKGAGGSYGFSSVSSFGDVIEQAAVDKNRDLLQNTVERLSYYLEHVEVTYA